MYLMYVDESGDCGINNSKTDMYILSGIVIHESTWKQTLDAMLNFRRMVKNNTGWKITHEFHAQDMINGRVFNNQNISKNQRFMILKHFIEWIAAQGNIRIITVCIKKTPLVNTPTEVFEKAWGILVQRFENTIKNRNFPSQNNNNTAEHGIIISDNTNGYELRKIVRKMRRYNPVPNQPVFGSGFRNLPITTIIEDPFMRNSEHSYFIQIADVCAYFARQYLKPNKIVKRQGATKYYEKLLPVVVKEASRRHPLGIVIL